MSTKDSKLISTSYGIMVGGFNPGGGYGKNSEVTAKVDKAAEMLAARFGLPVEERCNSNGKSGGAYHEKSLQHFSLHVNTVYKKMKKGDYVSDLVPAVDKSGRVKLCYQAVFDADPTCYGIEYFKKKRVPHQRAELTDFLKESPQVEVWSPRFDTLGQTMAWLVKYGTKYCASLYGK